MNKIDSYNKQEHINLIKAMIKSKSYQTSAFLNNIDFDKQEEVYDTVEYLYNEIDRLNNIINELERYLEQEIQEWQDVDEQATKAMVQEDKIILNILKELRGDSNANT